MSDDAAAPSPPMVVAVVADHGHSWREAGTGPGARASDGEVRTGASASAWKRTRMSECVTVSCSSGKLTAIDSAIDRGRSDGGRFPSDGAPPAARPGVAPAARGGWTARRGPRRAVELLRLPGLAHRDGPD